MRSIGACGLIIMAMSLLGSSEAWACRWFQPATPCVEWARASAVFIGRVIGVESAPPWQWRERITFENFYAFRGPETPTLDILTAYDGASCGLGDQMQRGDWWLAYAYAKGEHLYTDLC